MHMHSLYGVFMKTRSDQDILAKSVKKGWISEMVMVNLLKLPLVETVIKEDDVELNYFIENFLAVRKMKDIIEYKRHIMGRYVAFIDSRYIYVRIEGSKISEFGMLSPELKSFLILKFTKAEKSKSETTYSWDIYSTAKIKFPMTAGNGAPFSEYLLNYMVTKMSKVIAWLAYQDYCQLYAMTVLANDEKDRVFVDSVDCDERETYAGFSLDMAVRLNADGNTIPINNRRGANYRPQKLRHEAGARVVFLNKLPISHSDDVDSDGTRAYSEHASHHRRGHKRILTDERYCCHPMYRNPIGIWVKPCWVGNFRTVHNGSVYTVIER